MLMFFQSPYEQPDTLGSTWTVFEQQYSIPVSLCRFYNFPMGLDHVNRGAFLFSPICVSYEDFKNDNVKN